MGDNSQPKSVRLTSDELDFLQRFDEDFADIVHEAIDTKKTKTKNITRKQKINKAIINGFYVCLGMMFFMLLGQQTNIYSIIIIAGLGTMFTVVGAIYLYIGMKEEGMFGKHK